MALYTFVIDSNSVIVSNTLGYVASIQGAVVITTSVPSTGSPIIQIYKENKEALSFTVAEIDTIDGNPPDMTLLTIVEQLATMFATASGGGGGGNQNFANTDLTATGDRVHDFAGHALTIQNIGALQLLANDDITLTSQSAVNINTAGGAINIASGGNQDINLTSDGAITIGANVGSGINISAGDGIQLIGTVNANHLYLNADGYVELMSANGAALNIISNSNIFVESEGTINIINDTNGNQLEINADGSIGLTSEANPLNLNGGTDINIIAGNAITIQTADGSITLDATSTSNDDIFIQAAHDVQLSGSTNGNQISLLQDGTVNVISANASDINVSSSGNIAVSAIADPSSLLSLTSAHTIIINSFDNLYQFINVLDFVSNAAAITGGLAAGCIYRLTGTGALQIVT